MSSRANEVRRLLRERGPMTVAALCAEMKMLGKEKWVRECLKAMPDTYIKRWVRGAGMMVAIWACVVPPADAPRPEWKKSTMRREARRAQAA